MSDEDLPFSRTCYFCERARYVTYLYKDSWVDMCEFHFKRFDKIQDRKQRDFSF